MKRIRSLPRLPRRARDANKGDFGRVLVVGGSQGMIGAPALTANAALRGGAGLATVAVPQPIQPFVAVLCPCATFLPLPTDRVGELDASAVGQVLDCAGRCDVLAVGPGMGIGTRQQDIVRAVLGQDLPAVIDADGLNNLAKIDGWPVLRRCPLVLTPHPGEFARLTGGTVKDIQADRGGLAASAAQAWGRAGSKDAPLVCVLKGAGTVVTDGRRLYVNSTGNPGMATGGAGDVLTGLLAALIGQGLEPFEAACLAVHVHGLAGDLAAKALGEISLTTSNLLDSLPAAMKETIGR